MQYGALQIILVNFHGIYTYGLGLVLTLKTVLLIIVEHDIPLRLLLGNEKKSMLLEKIGYGEEIKITKREDV